MSQLQAVSPAADVGGRAGGLRPVNLIGGVAYESIGGIQTINRIYVRELEAAGLLGAAHFLWDRRAMASAEAERLSASGRVKFYGRDRSRFGGELLRRAGTFANERWLCTHLNYGLLGWAASGGRAARVGIIVHAAELDGKLSKTTRFVLRNAGRVVAVSEFTKRKVVGLGVAPSRVRVLPHGIDDPNPTGREPGRGEWPTILFVGRMDEHYKGQMELIDAMALLRERFPDLRLRFVGGGESLGRWRTEVERRRLADTVEFSGEVSAETLAAAYDTASLFAMPSGNEGFGLVYAEAMAHGLPCIGSDRDAAREIIADGQTGFCVPAGNATALAGAIAELLKSPDRRTQMGRAGRERFLAHFSAPRHRARLLAFLADWETVA